MIRRNRKKKKEKDKASIDVYMMLTINTLKNRVSKVKTNIMKEMDNKFDQIIDLIKKS